MLAQAAPRVVVGITGASGAAYGVRLLERLRELQVYTHLVATPAGVLIWGGHDEAGVRSDGATLDVTTGRWLPTPPLAASDARADAVGLVDARQVLLLWGTGVEGLRTDVLTLR